MHIFFADDSTQIGRRDAMGSVMAFGGILVPCEQIRPLTDTINGIATNYGIPDGTEIKWSPPRTNWIHSNLIGDNRENCYCEIMDATSAHGAKAVIVAWDTGRTTIQGDRAFERCFHFAFERVTIYLENIDDQCVFVADRPGGGAAQEDAFLADFLTRCEQGTEYVPPTRVVMNALTTPSHMVRQLQVADLVTSVTTAMVTGGYRYASPVFEHIKPMLIRSTLGSIGGTGLKLFPDSLFNLYHHILGESSYQRYTTATSLVLPNKDLPYYLDVQD